MMSSLEIAELAGKEHRNVKCDIRNLIDQGVINALNFEQIEYEAKVGFGYRKRDAYNFDFDGTMVLVTGYDAHRRMAIIKRWRELENGKQQFQIPQTYSEALALAAEMQRQRELDAPKVNYFDTVVAQAENMIKLCDYGRILKDKKSLPTGAKKIFTQLRICGIIMPGKSLPYDYFVDRGWFVVTEVDNGHNRVYPVTYVTAKGKVKILETLRAHGITA